MASEGSPTFRPDIEGLRGLAVLLIVAFHAGIPGLRGGFIGVDVFFVLSGFLITGLLLRGIQPAEFYARRARRILPALMTMLAVTMATAAILSPPLEQKNVAQAALATAGFASNIYFQNQAADYFGPKTDANPLLHTWSLGVEEQFYLVWPVLIWALIRIRTRLPLAIGILCILSLVSCFWLAAKHPAWAFYGSPARAWEFSAGSLALLLPNHFRKPWLGWAGLAAVLASGTIPISSGANPGISALPAVLGTMALLASPLGLAAKLLGHPALRGFGRLSYSWYLWHWPIMVLVGARAGRLSLPMGIACAAAALGFAWLTYRLIENPIRFHPSLIPRRALCLSLAGLLALAGIGASAAWREAILKMPQFRTYVEVMNDVPRFYQFDCRSEFLDAALHECSFGDAQSNRAIVLWGDSHAAQWFPPLESIANEHGFRLTPFIKMACPAAAIPAYQSKIGREEAQCAAWRNAALDRIVQLRPAVAVIAMSVEYVNASGSPLSYRQWLEGSRQTFSRLEQGGVPVLLLRDTPKADFNVPLCLARAAWRGSGECRILRSAALDDNVYRAELEAAQRAGNTAVADFSGQICDSRDCPVTRNGRIIFRDRDHIVASFAQTLTPVMEAQLAPYLR